jgi:hypothetical protein
LCHSVDLQSIDRHFSGCVDSAEENKDELLDLVAEDGVTKATIAVQQVALLL